MSSRRIVVQHDAHDVVCCRELGRLKEDDLRADEFGFSKPQAKVVLDAVKARKKEFDKS